MITTNNIGALMGAPVLGPDDEKIGTVGQVFLDPDSGHPNWMTVKTGLFGMKESFVPLDTAQWDHERVHIQYDKDLIKGAPRVDTDGALSQSEEADLYTYYGMSHADDGERETSGIGSDDPTAASAYTRMDTPGGPSSDPGTPGSDYSETGIGKRTDTDGSHKGAHAADAEFDAPPATTAAEARDRASAGERSRTQQRGSRMRRYEKNDGE